MISITKTIDNIINGPIKQHSLYIVIKNYQVWTREWPSCKRTQPGWRWTSCSGCTSGPGGWAGRPTLPKRLRTPWWRTARACRTADTTGSRTEETVQTNSPLIASPIIILRTISDSWKKSFRALLPWLLTFHFHPTDVVSQSSLLLFNDHFDLSFNATKINRWHFIRIHFRLNFDLSWVTLQSVSIDNGF